MEHSLEVFSKGILIFHSNGKWLYPLFELERFLITTDYIPNNLIVKDKIVGRAAALLLIRLEIGYIKAGIMSNLGKQVLDIHNVKYDYDKLVDRISCRTEEILKNENNPQKAYEILKKRAGL